MSVYVHILEHEEEVPKWSINYWEITIDITVGEYQHNEVHYFEGTKKQAHDWASNYLKFIWDVETVWDKSEEAWMADFPTRMARLNGVRGPIHRIQIELPDGKKGWANLV